MLLVFQTQRHYLPEEAVSIVISTHPDRREFSAFALEIPHLQDVALQLELEDLAAELVAMIDVLDAHFFQADVVESNQGSPGDLVFEKQVGVHDVVVGAAPLHPLHHVHSLPEEDGQRTGSLALRLLVQRRRRWRSRWFWLSMLSHGCSSFQAVMSAGGATENIVVLCQWHGGVSLLLRKQKLRPLASRGRSAVGATGEIPT